ncbi:DUF6443 domain-containing protein, partial [uncultured Bacteroides sp.]|uniref:DUF6443 domain-containing protein n=1 Tax=uncultured Bacteroides sp. TaxID=162156 RepID=UPI0026252409
MKRFLCLIITLGITIVLNAQTSAKNYIRSRIMSDENSISYQESIIYYDGLGRAFQQIQKGITPDKKNLVTLQEYDGMGRHTYAWLPVESTSAYLEANTFKGAATDAYEDDSRPNSYPVYEGSPLGRIVEYYGPGGAWNDRPVKTEYLVNGQQQPLACIHYAVDKDGDLSKETASFYATGELYVTKSTDEDRNVAYTFINRDGLKLLIRQMAGNVAHDTYFVYDDLDNLRFVLQPMFQHNPDVNLYAFCYKYDGRRNCVEKKLPGASPILYEYDQADRLVFSQDGNQRANNKWTYYLYDKLDRLTEQGECTGKNPASGKTV